jgi:hypothetical protein
MAAEILPEKVDFRTAIETGIGYAVIQGEKIRIGKITSGKFRLAEMIWHTFGIAQTIDTIFNATQPKNSSGGNISDPYTGPSRKLALLENQTKEINRSISSYAKRKKLKNLTFRINLNTDSRKHPKMAWFTKRVG